MKRIIILLILALSFSSANATARAEECLSYEEDKVSAYKIIQTVRSRPCSTENKSRNFKMVKEEINYLGSTRTYTNSRTLLIYLTIIIATGIIYLVTRKYKFRKQD